AWGCVESEQVLPTGNRPCASCAVKTGDDWKRIRRLDPAGAEGWVEQLETIVRLGFDRRIGDAPVLATVFSPLSIARKLSGDRLARLPGHVWNWDDRATGPALASGATRVGGAVCGGLDQWRTLLEGTSDAAAAEAKDAVSQTTGRGLIVGPGCVLVANTPDAN